MPSHSIDRAYDRKQKSLRLLCSKFLSMFDRDGVDLICLDVAAHQLGVTKRRIYDIVNVMESVGILSKKEKNTYNWNGFAAIPRTLEKLKEEGLKETICASHSSADLLKEENINAPQGNADAKILDGDVDEEDNDDLSINLTIGSQTSNPSSLSKSLSSTKGENPREPLGLLARSFIKLFLCSDAHIMSLDDSAKLLIGNSTRLKNKARRLYDIANVLSSLNLIEKTHAAVSRKPAYRWLGYKPNSNIQAASSFVANVNESKKRIFGADITNISVKSYKTGGSDDKDSSQQIRKRTNLQSLATDIVTSRSVHHSCTQSSKKYAFGPFAPIRLPKVSNSGSNKVRHNYDWENLASIHRPQYHNLALRDLFSHYKEAWEAWNDEVAEKKPVHQTI